MTRSKARTERSAGGVVVRLDGALRFLLIRDRNGNWGFPKGHIDGSEAPHETALREVAEETGVTDLKLTAPLGQIDWCFTAGPQLVHKVCDFYLFESRQGGVTPQSEEGIECCEWLDFETALRTLTHANSRRLLKRARRVLEQPRGPGPISPPPPPAGRADAGCPEPGTGPKRRREQPAD